MTKYLTNILIDTEDLLREIDKLDYELSGRLRAVFTKNKMTLIRLQPNSKFELIWEEREKPNA